MTDINNIPMSSYLFFISDDMHYNMIYISDGT